MRLARWQAAIFRGSPVGVHASPETGRASCASTQLASASVSTMVALFNIKLGLNTSFVKAIAGVRWQRYVPAGCRIRAAGDRDAQIGSCAVRWNVSC